MYVSNTLLTRLVIPPYIALVANAQDLIGERFGRWLVIGTTRRGGKPYCECTCDCGNSSTVRSSALTGGKSKSCGCLRAVVVTATNKARRNRDPWVAEMNTYISRLGYDLRAKRRKLVTTWELKLPEYTALSTATCYYCGVPPGAAPSTRLLKVTGVKKHGIDRVDSSKGYVSSNCVTSCCACNREKGVRDQGDFFKTTVRRYKHLKSQGLID